jgi:hypothetical protein
MAAIRTPVQYAETILGVHTEYEALESIITDLDDALKNQAALSVMVRQLRHSLSEREYEITCKVRAEYESSSQAAFDRKVKELIDADPDVQSFRQEILNASNRADTQSAEVRTLEVRAKAKNSRLVELGGLLHYYASCKEAQTEARKQVGGDPSRNWPY